jgi:cell division protein ZapA (FtsZ GTPase activity inhibitor)
MLIYGNTPSDIMRMMKARKTKLLSIAVIIFLAVMLMGCTAKTKPTLKALDKFWDTLGGKTTDLVKETK